jgi:Zn-dependent protease
LGWQDRQFDDRFRSGGGIGGYFRRVFGDGENIFSWGLPLYRLWGIAVKIHIFFVLYIVISLITSAGWRNIGWKYEATLLALLFGIVLLHEYGHCIACRRVRGTADEILLWPLGGLAYCAPPHAWKAHFWTAAGGPLVNVILIPLLGVPLYLLAERITPDPAWKLVLFNPFAPGIGSGFYGFGGSTLYTAYVVNAYLLAFNVLLPMYPMDGGRLMQSILWAKIGYQRSMRVSTTVGLVAAAALATLGLVQNETMLLAIALFGGITCWYQRQQLKMMGGDIPGYDFDRGFAGMPEPEPDREPTKRELRREAKRKAHEAEVDRILAKIKDEGMGSLTAREKRTLQKDTSEKRGT